MAVNEWQPIVPDWPAPPAVRALATTRGGGVSAPPFDSLNLGPRSGDAVDAVAENRRRLGRYAGLPSAPSWLAQVHGPEVVHAATVAPDRTEADAQWTDRPGAVLAVLTADCLPVVLCDHSGGIVAAAHAGWRGLAAGVLEATVAALPCAPSELIAWFGPAIGPARFEVGDEVRAAFVDADPAAAAAFRAGRPGHWWADLFALARRRLAAAGVTAVHGGELCTASDAARFFSHRRDGRTGRLATLIWRAA